MAYVTPQQTNPNDPNEQQGPSSQPSATGMSTPAPSTSSQASAPASQTPSSQPKGSGRFTNIQKYMQANQGAGARLAGGVEARVQSKVNPGVQQAESQAQNVREGIQAAQGKLQQGQQLQQQVADKNFDAQAFAAQEPNVQQFTQFRTGQAIDENALRGQAEQAQMQAMQAQQAAQGFGQQLGTEQGRQQLLKQTFSPTRNYTIGQQRLDNLFLQQASPQLQALQQDLNLKGQKLGNLSTEAQEKQKAIQTLAGDETALSQGLQTAIGAREQDVVSAAEARQDEVNKAREAAQEQARLQYQNLLEGKKVNKDFLQNIGLQSGQALFNVLRDQGNIDDYIKFNPTLLQGANQLASQEQRQKYDAIARLAGLDQSQRRIGLEDKTKNAVDYTGTLKQRVSDADKKFQDYIKATQVYGAPTEEQVKSLRGSYDADAAKSAMDSYRNQYGFGFNVNDPLSTRIMMATSMARQRAMDEARAQRAEANLGNIVNSISNLGPGQLQANNQDLIDRINQAAMGTQQQTTGSIVADRAREMARSQIQQDVLKRLSESGYFNRIQEDEPTLPTGNIFNVT